MALYPSLFFFDNSDLSISKWRKLAIQFYDSLRCSSQCHIINLPPVELKLTLLFYQTHRSRLVMDLGVVCHTAIFWGRTKILTLATWNCSFRRNMLTCLMFPNLHPLPASPISEPSLTKPGRFGTPFSYLLSNDGCNSFFPYLLSTWVFFFWRRVDGLKLHMLSGHQILFCSDVHHDSVAPAC
jgi:hypothetical protein